MENVKNAFGKFVFALYLVLVFSLAFMKPTVDVGFAAVTPTDVVFPLFFVAWLAGLAIGAYRLQWRAAYWALALYVGALVVSTIFSINPTQSSTKLAGVIFLCLLAITSASVVDSMDRLRLSILAWLVGATSPILVALAGVVMFYVSPGNSILPYITYHYGAVPIGNFPRISSTFVSASMFCNYLTVTLMLSLIAHWRGWIRRNLAFFLVVMIAISATFTVSIGLGGLVLAIGAWMWLIKPAEPISRIVLISGVVAAIAFLGISLVELPRISENKITPSSRVLVWSDALKTFSSDPITGKGLGTGAASVAYQNSDGTWSLLTDAHNTFLNVAAESGVIGLLALLGVIFVVVRSVFQTEEDDQNLKLMAVKLGIAFATAFLYEGLTGSFEDARHLWVLVGWIFACERISTVQERSLASS